jgi:hypothetical protein
VLDFLQALLHPRIGRSFEAGEVCVPITAVEEVIEIVRDSAGKDAEAFELLLVAQFEFEVRLFLLAAQSLSNVAADGLDTHG